MSVSPTDPTAVRIDVRLAASPDVVWRAWTEREWLSRWFGSTENGRVLAASLDVRPGGAFAVTFADGDGTEHTCSGLYEAVDIHRHLAFSWQWKSEPGVQTRVSVTLVPQASGTLMKFEHSRLFEASAHDYATGWRKTFLKLERVLGEM